MKNKHAKRTLKIGIIILVAVLAILGCLLFAKTADGAYQIPKEFKPSNAPFDLTFIHKEAGGEAGTTALLIILQIIAGALLYFAGPLAVLAIGLVAFDWAMYSGSAEKVETAKKRLTWAILGLILIVLSYTLVKLLTTLLPPIFVDTSEVPATEQSQEVGG